MRYRVAYACNRTLGLAYRGLDWLPPGDVSFADLVGAMLAADRDFFPNDPRVRERLSKEAQLRAIPLAKTGEFVTRVEVPLNAAARRRFVERYREAFGIPADARVTVTVRNTHIYVPPLLPKHTSEIFDLKPNMSRWTSVKTEHYLIKLAWWQREGNDLEGWGTHRRYRTGATIVAEKSGRVRAVLQKPTYCDGNGLALRLLAAHAHGRKHDAADRSRRRGAPARNSRQPGKRHTLHHRCDAGTACRGRP